MLAVTLDFDFRLIVRVRTVVAAVRFESGNLTLTLRVCAFAPAPYIDNFCHNAPLISEFADPSTQGLHLYKAVAACNWPIQETASQTPDVESGRVSRLVITAIQWRTVRGRQLQIRTNLE